MPKLFLSPATAQVTPALRVHAVGFREDMPPGFVDRPQGQRESLVMCFHDPVDVWLDGRIQRIAAGHSVIWTPHRKHLFGRADAPWSHTWTYADGPLADQLIARAPDFLINRLLPATTEAVVLKYMQLFYDELLSNAPPDPFVCERLFELLIRELTRAVRPSATSQPVPPAFQEVRQFVEANLHRRLYLKDLAAVAHLSISRFSAEFQRWFGVAPMQYLHRQRMRRAAWLLLDSHLRISAVAFELGFDDPLYFSRQFKRLMGENPTAYRQNHLTAG